MLVGGPNALCPTLPPGKTGVAPVGFTQALGSVRQVGMQVQHRLYELHKSRSAPAMHEPRWIQPRYTRKALNFLRPCQSLQHCRQTFEPWCQSESACRVHSEGKPEGAASWRPAESSPLKVSAGVHQVNKSISPKPGDCTSDCRTLSSFRLGLQIRSWLIAQKGFAAEHESRTHQIFNESCVVPYSNQLR
jgi:hypothetical protein